MLDLLKKIQLQKIRIEQGLEEKSPVIEFYRELLKDNSYNTLSRLINADKCELLTAVILRLHPDYDVEEVKEMCEGIRPLLEEGELSTGQALADVLDTLLNSEQCDDILEILKTKKTISKKELRDVDDKIARDCAIVLADTIRDMNLDQKSFAMFVELYKNSEPYFVSQVMVSTFALNDIKMMKDMFKDIMGIAESVGDAPETREKDKERFIRQQVKGSFNLDILMEPYIRAIEYGQSLMRAEENKKRALAKEKKQYERLENEIYDALQGGEITNAEALIKKIPSDEIRRDVLKLVYEHNAIIYKEKSKMYEKLSASDSRHYQVLLAKYGVSPETYSVGTVMNNSIEDLTSILSTLNKLKIKNPKTILQIAQTSNLETVNNLSSLAERGIVSIEMINTHVEMFNTTSPEYESFMKNLALLQQKRINPHYLKASQEIFLTPSQVFSQSIKTIEDYSLLQAMKTGMDVRFLSQTNLAPAIDVLLELGYEKNLEENIEILNYKDKFERLRVLKALNVPLTTTKDIIAVLSTDKFIMSDDDIREYLYNAVEHHLPKNITTIEESRKKVSDVVKLEEFNNSERTYSFDGVLISKNKVHRNLSTISSGIKPSDRLLYAVIKGSILSDEEYEKVESKIKNKKSGTTLKKQ